MMDQAASSGTKQLAAKRTTFLFLHRKRSSNTTQYGNTGFRHRDLPPRGADHGESHAAKRDGRGLPAVATGNRVGHVPQLKDKVDGIAKFRRFIERAADLVVSYGGSFSGEHGDGQSRGELLPKMFGDDLVRAFGQLALASAGTPAGG
jgi:FAD linked oxidases, C-terminal domain